MSFELNPSLPPIKQYRSVGEVLDEQTVLLQTQLNSLQPTQASQEISLLQQKIAELEKNIRLTSLHLEGEQKSYTELQNEMTTYVKNLQPEQISALVPKMTEIANWIQQYTKQCEVFKNNIATAQKEIAQVSHTENERARLQKELLHLEFGKKICKSEQEMDLSNDFSNNNSNSNRSSSNNSNSISNNSNINEISKNNSKSAKVLPKNKASEINHTPNKKIKQHNQKGTG